jgi:hypothetical protein
MTSYTITRGHWADNCDVAHRHPVHSATLKTMTQPASGCHLTAFARNNVYTFATLHKKFGLPHRVRGFSHNNTSFKNAD